MTKEKHPKFDKALSVLADSYAYHHLTGSASTVYMEGIVRDGRNRRSLVSELVKAGYMTTAHNYCGISYLATEDAYLSQEPVAPSFDKLDALAYGIRLEGLKASHVRYILDHPEDYYWSIVQWKHLGEGEEVYAYATDDLKSYYNREREERDPRSPIRERGIFLSTTAHKQKMTEALFAKRVKEDYDRNLVWGLEDVCEIGEGAREALSYIGGPFGSTPTPDSFDPEKWLGMAASDLAKAQAAHDYMVKVVARVQELGGWEACKANIRAELTRHLKDEEG